ncbi:MAG: HutP family protein [Halanaerobiales bacterium]
MEQSLIIAKTALRLAISDRQEENKLKKKYLEEKGIKTAALDFGGEYNKSVKKIIENAVIAARRENLINETHSNQGAVAGAAHEALKQIMGSAVGLNIGGKIGIARKEDHLVVAIFFGVGMLNLNEVAIGLSHRTIS